MLKKMLFRILQSIADCFLGYAFFAQVAAAALTYVLIVSGFDWWYFEVTRSPALIAILFFAAPIGFLVPILVPSTLYVASLLQRHPDWRRAAYALVQAELVAAFVSGFYKALTGRVHPVLFSNGPFTDISHEFHFGLLERGVFWGWPSSHTAVAFAAAAMLATIFPKRRALVITAFLYALYIGIGVSTTIHWFSDFIAGAIVGTTAGIVVGKSILKLHR